MPILVSLGVFLLEGWIDRHTGLRRDPAVGGVKVDFRPRLHAGADDTVMTY
jgi:hypothetical protein